MDVYESSLWTSIKGGEQVQPDSDCSDSNPDCADVCDRTGNDCKNVFARSVKGVTPVGNVTWFQAQQACANAGKRLLSNGEWQLAAAGTPKSSPDDQETTCNTSTGSIASTGSRSSCVSNGGVYDMVGNRFEWVAEWVPASTLQACTTLQGGSLFGIGDHNCFGGASETSGPGGLLRGGYYQLGDSGSGVFTVIAHDPPSHRSEPIGFRCAR